MQVHEYYEQVRSEAKEHIQNLRSLILGLMDNPEEVISYQIPHFISKGKRVVAIAAWKHHIALYPLSTKTLKKFSKELSGYKTSAGTIQFNLDQKLPDDLIRRIVKHRLLELFDN